MKKTAFTKPFKDFPNLMSLMLLFLGGQIITLAACLLDLGFLYGGVFQECIFLSRPLKNLGLVTTGGRCLRSSENFDRSDANQPPVGSQNIYSRGTTPTDPGY